MTKKYDPKYDNPKYESSTSKYDSSNKYEPSKYENIPSKYEHGRTSSGRSYYHQHPHGGERTHSSHERDREREVRHFDYDPSLVLPPGTEPSLQVPPPSLFEAVITPDQPYVKPGHGEDPASYYKGKLPPHPQPMGNLRQLDLESLSMTPDSERGGIKEVKDHHRHHKSVERKSEDGAKVEKKVKKEKKKHKKKTRDEKDKKSKKKKTKTDKTDENPKEESDEEDGGSDSGTAGSRRNSGEADPDLSETAAGVICDSTVKSPERHKELDPADTLVLPELKVEITNELSSYETGHGVGQSNPIPVIDSSRIEETRGSDLIANTKGTILSEKKESEEASASQTNCEPSYYFTCLISVEEEVRTQVPIPPSKWDKDEDDSDGPPGEDLEPVETATHDKHDTKTDETLVTSEVLKRAESAIFQKAIGGIAGVRTAETDKKPSPKRKSGKASEESVLDKSKGNLILIILLVGNITFPKYNYPAIRPTMHLC